MLSCLFSPSLFPVDLLEDLEDLDEEVDDVEVELDCSHDVLLGTQPGHDHLCVEDDEEGEEESSTHSHGGLCQLTPNEEVHEAPENEDEESGVEGGADIGEVALGLEGEGCQANDHGQ